MFFLVFGLGMVGAGLLGSAIIWFVQKKRRVARIVGVIFLTIGFVSILLGALTIPPTEWVVRYFGWIMGGLIIIVGSIASYTVREKRSILFACLMGVVVMGISMIIIWELGK